MWSFDFGFVVVVVGFGSFGFFLDSEFDNEVDMLNVNCCVVFEMSYVFGQWLCECGCGGFILMSLLFVFQGVLWVGNYVVMKVYIQLFVEVLYIEFVFYGVDVVVLVFGFVCSGFVECVDMMMSMLLSIEVVVRGILCVFGCCMMVCLGVFLKVFEWVFKMLLCLGWVWIL